MSAGIHAILDPRLAHDLRSKINAVLLALDVVQLGRAERRAEALSRARRNVRDMSGLIDRHSGVYREACAESPLPVPNGTRVLLVEDDFALAQALSDLLTEAGCKVVGPAVSMDETIKLIARHVLDCAVVETELDGTPSTPILEVLSADGIPAIMLGMGEKNELPAEFQSLPLLRKPISPIQLLKQIAAMNFVSPKSVARHPPARL